MASVDIANRIKMLISRHLSSPAGTSAPVASDVMTELCRIIHRGYGADVLEAIKEPLKHGVPVVQSKALQLLDQIIKNTPPDFILLVAGNDWTERLFRASKTTTSNDVADQLMLAVLDWYSAYPAGGFAALIQRYANSKVLGARFAYLRSEFDRTRAAQRQIAGQQQQRGADPASPMRQGHYYADPGAGLSGAQQSTVVQPQPQPQVQQQPQQQQQQQQLRQRSGGRRVQTLDTMLMDAQGDMAALEYGIQHPDMLSDETARDCAKHKMNLTNLLENPGLQISEEERNTVLLVLEQIINLLGFHDAMCGTAYVGQPAARSEMPVVPSPQARDADDEDDDRRLQAALAESSRMSVPRAVPQHSAATPAPPVSSADVDLFPATPNPSVPTFGSPGPAWAAQRGPAAPDPATMADLEEQRRQVSTLNADNASLQARLRTLETERSDLESDLAKAKEQAESLAKKYAVARERNKEAVDMGQQLDLELSAANDRVRQLEQAIAEKSSAPPPPPEIREVIREVKPKVDRTVVAGIHSKIATLRGDLSTVRKESRSFASLADQFAADLGPKIDQVFAAARVDRQKDQDELKALQALYRKEVLRRKEYYNQLQELKGNIRVYCRIRPMSERELKDGHEDITSFPSDEEIRLVDDKQKIRTFEFDSVFGPNSTQEQVFTDTMPLIDSVVDGYNVCIFAYGQTGSGKTHTMNGNPSMPGINRRALQRLFEVLAERESTEECSVRVSVLEIYNEGIRDLLVPKKQLAASYEIRSGGKFGQYVTNLSEEVVTSAEAINDIMTRASSNRTEGATNMNAHSSRSHMIVYIIVTSTNRTTGAQSYGKLSLVDLAGSERLDKSGAEGAAAKEAVAINKSLTALGDTIASLSQAAKHVPYRNSTLTYLLQDSMSGQAKVLMFCCASPASYNTQETISSLTFALRARGVSLGQVKKNA